MVPAAIGGSYFKMKRLATLRPFWRRVCGPVLLATSLVALLSTGASAQSRPNQAPGILAVSPEKGAAGTSFTVTGVGVAPGASVDIQWTTWDGTYTTQTTSETVAYQQ